MFAPGRASRTSPHTQRRPSDSGLAPRVQGPSHAQRPPPDRGPQPSNAGPPPLRPQTSASRAPPEPATQGSPSAHARSFCPLAAARGLPGQRLPVTRATGPTDASPLRSLPLSPCKAKQSKAKKDRNHWWSFYHRPAVPMFVEKNKKFTSGMQNGADNLENIPGAALKD